MAGTKGAGTTPAPSPVDLMVTYWMNRKQVR